MTATQVRPATPEDAGLILGFIRELAAYERQPDAVKASEADLVRDGFGASPRFEARIGSVDGRPAGFTLFFPNYSTWEGRAGIYLEDIYVQPWARRHGLGRHLLADLARLALERGGARLDFSVLDWNPARGFYAALGIEHNADWLPYRATGDALRRLAAAAR
jgi:GNAT superfamily N-acetyltransferase